MKIIKPVFIVMTLIFSVVSNGTLLPVIDIKAVMELKEQYAVLTEQCKYLKQQLSVLDFDKYKWEDPQRVIDNLSSIVEQAGELSYSAEDINEKFKDSFPGYEYRKEALNKYKTVINNTQETLKGILQSANANLQTFKSENERLKVFQQQVMNAISQTQAIQASTQITSEIVSQIQLLRQTILSQINAETTYFAEQIQHVATEKEELEKIIDKGSMTVPDYGTSGKELTVPDFTI